MLVTKLLVGGSMVALTLYGAALGVIDASGWVYSRAVRQNWLERFYSQPQRQNWVAYLDEYLRVR